MLGEIDPGTRFQLGSIFVPGHNWRGIATDLDLHEQLLTPLDLATLQSAQECRRELLLSDHQIGYALSGASIVRGLT